MGPLNKRQKAYRLRALTQNKKFATSQDPEDHLEDQDDFDMSHPYNVALRNKKTLNEVLRDTTDEKSNRPKTYERHSRQTIWRRKIEAANVRENNKLITSYPGFTTVRGSTPAQRIPVLTRGELELIKIDMMIPKLLEFIRPVMNSKKEGSHVYIYNFVRYSAIHVYFRNRLEGDKVGVASKKAAINFWAEKPTVSRPRAVVKWAREFLELGYVTDHKQGVHAKRKSFLDDADVRAMVVEEIRKTKPALRSIKVIKKFIDEKVVPFILGVANRTVCETTISKYLYEWGYGYRKNERQIYFDGHEREDVVKYRDQWSRRMLGYMEKMDFYTGANEEEVLPPILEEGESKYVFVTHDESTFYANDGKKDMWLEDGENYIRKKGPGSSIMVSEFQCPCHGTMKVSPGWTSRQLFKAGESREGWWTYRHMVDQLKNDAIPIFEHFHPGCTAIFLFDNSSNHGAMADDALVTTRMTLKEKPWPLTKQYQFRDTIAPVKGGETMLQEFYYDKEVSHTNRKGKTTVKKERYFKGIRRILEERGQWVGHDTDGIDWKLHCKAPDPANKICCARHRLETCDDFVAQRSALQEVVEESGHIFELYPKYHCECNWIEMYWAGAKREARLQCDYTFKSLESNVDSFLDTAGDIVHIRRYFRRAMDYIEAYSKSSKGREVVQEVKKFVEKQYLSKRKVRIPSDLLNKE